MPPANRHDSKRTECSDSDYSLMEFMREFPDDDACLEHLWRSRYSPDGEHAECPKCERERPFKKYATKQGRQSWCCTACGHWIHPTAGTIFHKSTTNLQMWFWAIFLMSSTRCGLAAKHLEREIGVSYKTAHRMFKQIRTLLDDGGSLSGRVEIDETYMGGRRKRAPWGGRPGPNDSTKPPVLAMVERQGKVKARVVPNVKRKTLLPEIQRYVEPESVVYTDELKSYDLLANYYSQHWRIPHSLGIYIQGHIYTNTAESFFALLKGGIWGTYRGVSTRYLQNYFDEYAWRWNHKYDRRSMFQTILDQVEKDRPQLVALPRGS